MKTEVVKEFRITSTKATTDLWGHTTYVLYSRHGEAWEVVRGDHAGLWHAGMDVSIAATIDDSITTMDWDGDEARQLTNLSRREAEEVFDDS